MLHGLQSDLRPIESLDACESSQGRGEAKVGAGTEGMTEGEAAALVAATATM